MLLVHYRFVFLILVSAPWGATPNPLQSEFNMAGGNQPLVINGQSMPIQIRDDVTVLTNHYEILPNFRYLYRFELSDGTKRFEVGYVRHVNGVPFTTVSEGYYIYRAPDGRYVRMSYLADQNGVHIIDSFIGDLNPDDIEAYYQQLISIFVRVDDATE